MADKRYDAFGFRFNAAFDVSEDETEYNDHRHHKYRFALIYSIPSLANDHTEAELVSQY